MALAGEDRSSIESWKRKYYDSLEQIEQKERQWQQVEDLLRKTISRLTLAADGLDETLDVQLKALRDAIRDRAGTRELQSRIEAMSATLVKLDSKRAVQNALPGPVEVLAELLDKTPFPRSARREARALGKRLRNMAPEQAGEAVTAFTTLLASVLEERQSGDSGTGLLDRLFPRRDSAAEEAAGKGDSGRPAPASGLAGGRDILLHLLERLASRPDAADILARLRQQVLHARTEKELRRLAEELAGVLGERVPEKDATAPDGDAAIREVLVQLLQRLSLPPEFEETVDSLKDRLEDRSARLDVEQTLSDLADLIQNLRERAQEDKKEIEDFLHQLTDRLQDIDAYVSGSEAARVEAYENGRHLGDRVQEQVKGIETSVRDAENLDQLKDMVQSRLDTIIRHVEEHRAIEERRHREAEERLREMQERLAAMEEQTGELKERVRKERDQALTDTLTGIPNRLAWEERVKQEYARWKRFGTPLTLLVWDVDHFKRINDEFGHRAGDKVLKVIANLLADNVRETDFVARYGGEEFTVLMPGADPEAARGVAEKLRAAVEHCGFHYKGDEVPITISCGIAGFRDGDSVEAVFERADRALYQAKAEGRNRCVVAD